MSENSYFFGKIMRINYKNNEFGGNYICHGLGKGLAFYQDTISVNCLYNVFPITKFAVLNYYDNSCSLIDFC